MLKGALKVVLLTALELFAIILTLFCSLSIFKAVPWYDAEGFMIYYYIAPMFILTPHIIVAASLIKLSKSLPIQAICILIPGLLVVVTLISFRGWGESFLWFLIIINSLSLFGFTIFASLTISKIIKTNSNTIN